MKYYILFINLSIGQFNKKLYNNKLAPKGLELTHEPTIGNYGQSFIDNW